MNKKNTELFVQETLKAYEKIRKSKLDSWTTWSSDDIFWIVFPNRIMYQDFLVFIDEPHKELEVISEQYQDIAFIRIIWEEHH